MSKLRNDGLATVRKAKFEMDRVPNRTNQALKEKSKKELGALQELK